MRYVAHDDDNLMIQQYLQSLIYCKTIIRHIMISVKLKNIKCIHYILHYTLHSSVQGKRLKSKVAGSGTCWHVLHYESYNEKFPNVSWQKKSKTWQRAGWYVNIKSTLWYETRFLDFGCHTVIWHVLSSFPGFSGCNTVKWYNFLNITDCSNICFHYLHITDDF